jgi:DNA-binding MurR/RpiR family transcriptional regulator
MTASKLGATVGVSESTVVRFATEIGFDGYPALQRELKEMIRNRLTSIQRIEVTNEQIGNDDVLDKVLNMDIDKIRRTLEETSREDFNRAVDAIVAAENIYVIGAKSAATLARFITYYFNLMLSTLNCPYHQFKRNV